MFSIFGALFGLIGFLTFGAIALAGLTLFSVFLIPLLILGVFFRIGFGLAKFAVLTVLAIMLIGVLSY
jgi:hypothetical protein